MFSVEDLARFFIMLNPVTISIPINLLFNQGSSSILSPTTFNYRSILSVEETFDGGCTPCHIPAFTLRVSSLSSPRGSEQKNPGQPLQGNVPIHVFITIVNSFS